MNESTSPNIFFSSYATNVESNPPDKNTPNFRIPKVHIFTVSCASCLNCSALNFDLDVGTIICLLEPINLLLATSYTSVSPGMTFLIFLNNVLRVAFIPE